MLPLSTLNSHATYPLDDIESIFVEKFKFFLAHCITYRCGRNVIHE